MIIFDDVLDHELLGVDGSGSLCSCGQRVADWLEHLGHIALGTVPAVTSTPRQQWMEGVANKIDRLMDLGHTNAYIIATLDVGRNIVRARRKAWRQFSVFAVEEPRRPKFTEREMEIARAVVNKERGEAA